MSWPQRKGMVHLFGRYSLLYFDGNPDCFQVCHNANHQKSNQYAKGAIKTCQLILPTCPSQAELFLRPTKTFL
ncbi:hypothetical protein GDO78_006542 [Eleutherodactylus coqui]|uniref:Uncharacterized protein n=1 Tax=Eleutherodactylus coqui TaxID=57060 RepID=A0A8J6FNR0_ELECQ|nr:hypothetical protein GDO78_006542 [Eleutherodactylus coqui]